MKYSVLSGFLAVTLFASGGVMAQPGVRLENGNYPTLRLFFVQRGIDCT